jgi:hypothetical protein
MIDRMRLFWCTLDSHMKIQNFDELVPKWITKIQLKSFDSTQEKNKSPPKSDRLEMN